jgi:hypothetical protein
MYCNVSISLKSISLKKNWRNFEFYSLLQFMKVRFPLVYLHQTAALDKMDMAYTCGRLDLDDYNKEVEEAATLLLWLEHG